MKKLIRPIVYLLVFVLAFTGISANNTYAATNENANTTKNNQVEFENHIKELAKTDQEAKTAYEQYFQLSTTDKEKFVELLYSEEYAKALQAANTLEPGESKSFHGGDIKAVVTEEETPQNNMNTLGGYYSVSERNVVHKVVVFGIFATIYWVSVRFKHDYGTRNVTQTLGADNGHTNINPSIIVSDGVVGHYPAGGWAYGWGKFRIAATGSIGSWSFTHTLNIKTDNVYTTGWIN